MQAYHEGGINGIKKAVHYQDRKIDLDLQADSLTTKTNLAHQQVVAFVVMALQTQESGVVGLEHNIMDVQGDTKFLPDQSQKNEHGKESNFTKTLIS